MHDKPDWSALFETASAQDGYFTTQQAAKAGYSRPLLSRHLRSERIVRVQRGIYRVVNYPPSDHESLVVVWLWTAQVGVFSHETALSLHDLSDALPAKMHITVPEVWNERRLRIPQGVILHYSEVGAVERTWFGAIPVTEPERTLLDCVAEQVMPDLLEQAHSQALRRGLLAKELAAVRSYLSDARDGA
jgi:predicted transcriptional regulator of viral defense system